MADDLQTLGVILALLGTVVGIYIQLRKLPSERQSIDISASASAAEALRSYSDEIRKLRDEIAAVRLDVIRRDEIIAQRDRELKEQGDYIQSLLRGIERLIAQIRSLDHTPVWTPTPVETGK